MIKNLTQDQVFFKYVSISVAGHIALVLFFALKGAFYNADPILIQKAIHVDLVGLPDKYEPEQVAEAVKTSESTKKPEPAKAEPPSKSKAAEAAKPSINLNSKKKEDLANKQKKAMSKLKAMDALEKIESEVQAEAAKKQKPIKGVAVSSGDSLTGLDRIEYERYFGEVEQHLKQNWTLPSWMMELDVRAQALVQIDDKGYVTMKKLITASGNPDFDEKVLESIDRSSPFPAPPDRLVGVLKNRGIVFNFPK